MRVKIGSLMGNVGSYQFILNIQNLDIRVCGIFHTQAQLSIRLQASKFTLLSNNSNHSLKKSVDDLTLKPVELALK
jgi:hypothetical protein